MRLQDLNRAARLAEERRQLHAMIAKIETGPVALTVGEGRDQSAIALSSGYVASIVIDVKSALTTKICKIDADLAEIGVYA